MSKLEYKFYSVLTTGFGASWAKLAITTFNLIRCWTSHSDMEPEKDVEFGKEQQTSETAWKKTWTKILDDKFWIQNIRWHVVLVMGTTGGAARRLDR